LDSTPGAAALAEAELAQFHTLYEEYEINLLRENDAPMSLILALPPISIPEFNGEYLEWPRFHDLFLELVHNKPYSASQKLHILQSSLRGEARNVLTDTVFSQGGYDDTWLRLKARYQNGKKLVFAAIAKIIDHNPIDGSSRQLRALHDTMKNSMSTLKNFDVSTKSWASILYDNPRGYTLLATAKVSLQGATDYLQTCRAVIDGGSQVNLISRRMADLLSLKEMPLIEISGIGGKNQQQSDQN